MIVGCGGDSGGSDADAGASDSGATETDAAPIEVGDPLEWALGEAGPFHAGHRTFEHTYQPEGQTAPRTIRVHVWYPTHDTRGTRTVYNGIITDRATVTDATLAPAAHASGRYPVHAYSHGHQGLAGGAAFLHRHLASHGWVTVAPDHTNNTLLDNVDPRSVALYYLRSLDVRAAVDAVAAGAIELGDPDTEHLLLSGHSFGTHTVWASTGATFDVDRIAAERCSESTPCTAEELDVFRAGVRDPRVLAAVPMGGLVSSDWFGESGQASVEIPLLAMTGGADANTMAGAMAQFERAEGLDFTWVDVAGACHEFFGLGCNGDGEGEREAIVGAMVLALGRRHVLGDESAAVSGVLDGSISVSDRVTLRQR